MSAHLTLIISSISVSDPSRPSTSPTSTATSAIHAHPPPPLDLGPLIGPTCPKLVIHIPIPPQHKKQRSTQGGLKWPASFHIWRRVVTAIILGRRSSPGKHPYRIELLCIGNAGMLTLEVERPRPHQSYIWKPATWAIEQPGDREQLGSFEMKVLCKGEAGEAFMREIAVVHICPRPVATLVANPHIPARKRQRVIIPRDAEGGRMEKEQLGDGAEADGCPARILEKDQDRTKKAVADRITNIGSGLAAERLAAPAGHNRRDTPAGGRGDIQAPPHQGASRTQSHIHSSVPNDLFPPVGPHFCVRWPVWLTAEEEQRRAEDRLYNHRIDLQRRREALAASPMDRSQKERVEQTELYVRMGETEVARWTREVAERAAEDEARAKRYKAADMERRKRRQARKASELSS